VTVFVLVGGPGCGDEVSVPPICVGCGRPLDESHVIRSGGAVYTIEPARLGRRRTALYLSAVTA
jgi:hypothetical protein